MEPHNHNWVLDPHISIDDQDAVIVHVWAECVVEGCSAVLAPEEVEDRLNQHERIVPFEK
jgi:hypothetical protein